MRHAGAGSWGCAPDVRRQNASSASILARMTPMGSGDAARDSATTVSVGDEKVRDPFGALSEAIDRRAPGLVRFLAALRWGGLRTIRPDPLVWSVESATAVGAGLGVRAGVTALTRGRLRVPVVAAVATAAIGTHMAIWRWDTLRWRRHRVALVVDLPASELIGLAEELTAAGLPVERWERGVRAGRRVHGLWCRTGDVRAVNRAIDAVALAAGVR